MLLTINKRVHKYST